MGGSRPFLRGSALHMRAGVGRAIDRAVDYHRPPRGAPEARDGRSPSGALISARPLKLDEELRGYRPGAQS